LGGEFSEGDRFLAVGDELARDGGLRMLKGSGDGMRIGMPTSMD
jgi:hypothetical protein